MPHFGARGVRTVFVNDDKVWNTQLIQTDMNREA